MAEKSGFFNARNVDGVYDRKYNANDYSDNLAVVIASGVLRSTADDLKVTASGMVATAAAGRAWINGHYYYNDSPLSFTAVTAPIGGKRWDRVMLRLDKSVNERKISLVYVQGTEANTPVKPSPTRAGNIYDLVIADIYVDTNATSLAVTDTRSDTSVCGWVYSTSGDNSFFTSLDGSFNTWFQEKKNTLSSVTLFKRYQWTTTLASNTSTVSFSIPQYDSDTCFLEVYVNGIFDGRHTISGSTITFTGTLVAGTKVTVNCYKSIDGTGIQTVSEEITDLQNRMDAVEAESSFAFKCTGTNDNWSLTQIAQAIFSGEYFDEDLTTAALAFMTKIGGRTWLGALPVNAQVTIKVVGNLGATTPVYGSGTTASRYRFFEFGKTTSTNRKVVFDFSECSEVAISCAANTDNIIFYGTDLNIKNANVKVTSAGTGTHVQMIAGSANTGNINVDGCKFKMQISGKAIIAENGNFTNCYCWASSSLSHAILFVPKSDSLIRLIGGTYYAYIAASGQTSSVLYTYSTETNAVIMAYNINVPTVSETGFSQQYLSTAFAGKTYINGVVSTMTTQGTFNEVVGQVWKSKR